MPTTRPVSLVPRVAPTAAELRALTARVASAVRGGAFTAPRAGTSARFELAGVDMRVVAWAPGARSRLHDRGGAAGAFTVVSGSLTEYVPTGWSDGWMWLRPIERAAGDPDLDGAGFGRHHIHELANESGEPAVSVHACFPALVTARYYDVVGGDLVRVDDVARADTVDLATRWAS